MSFLKNLAIRKKIALAFSIIAAINIIFGAYLYRSLHSIQDDVLNLTDDTLPSMMMVNNIKYNMSSVRRAQIGLLSATDSHEIAEDIRWMDDHYRSISNDLARYENSIWTSHERSIFMPVKNLWQEYLRQLSAFNDDVLSNNIVQAQNDLQNALPTFERLELAVDELLQLNLSYVDNNRTELTDLIGTITQFSISSIVALLGFMVFMTWLLANLICRPLQQVVAQANAIADGNLGHQLNRQQIGQDELGELADACSTMQNNLRVMVEEIVAGATQLTQAVDEVSAVSEQTSQGMREQQEEVMQIATAMTEMKSTVAEVARSTEVASDSARNSNQQAITGAQQMNVVANSIIQVTQEISQAEQRVLELEDQAQQINMVVDVISNIADQTNLLALNAAIEAARAGEQGRGFAVVADEVRTLASRTNSSAGEIKGMIERMVQSSQQSVEAVDQCLNQLEQTKDSASDSGEQLRAILQQVQSVLQSAEIMSTTLSQQGQASQEIAESAQELSSMAIEQQQQGQRVVDVAQGVKSASDTLAIEMKRFSH